MATLNPIASEFLGMVATLSVVLSGTVKVGQSETLSNLFTYCYQFHYCIEPHGFFKVGGEPPPSLSLCSFYLSNKIGGK